MALCASTASVARGSRNDDDEDEEVEEAEEEGEDEETNVFASIFLASSSSFSSSISGKEMAFSRKASNSAFVWSANYMYIVS